MTGERLLQGDRGQPGREEPCRRGLRRAGCAYSTRGRTRRSASHLVPVTPGSHPSRDSPTAPTETHSLWAEALCVSSTRGRARCLRRPTSRHGRPPALAFTGDGSLLAVLNDDDHAPRDAATLEQVGGPIALRRLHGTSIRRIVPRLAAIRPHPRWRLGRHRLGRRRARMVGHRSRTKTRTIQIERGHHALALSPDGLTAAVGVERGIQLVDLRTERGADRHRAR